MGSFWIFCIVLFFLGGAFWNKESKVFDDDDDERDWVLIVDEGVSFFISIVLECVLCQYLI